MQGAFASPNTFAIGAAMPLLTTILTPHLALIPVVVAAPILFLALLDGFGVCSGCAPCLKAAARVTFWGALAMAIPAGLGAVLVGCGLSKTKEPMISLIFNTAR